MVALCPGSQGETGMRSEPEGFLEGEALEMGLTDIDGWAVGALWRRRGL